MRYTATAAKARGASRMRKISLTDGKLSVDIVPDCGGAISALRWRAPSGQICDLLHPAAAGAISGRVANAFSCLPIASFGNIGPQGDVPGDLAEWTVQDASNIRATLTAHKEAGALQDPGPAAHWTCQILQRLELGLNGLRLQLTVTNIGVQPMPARIGMRLHVSMHDQTILRGSFAPVALSGMSASAPAAPSAGSFADGFSPGRRDVHVCQRNLGREVRFEWPREELALRLILAQGLDFVRLDYNADQRELWLTPLSHTGAPTVDTAGCQILQQGDSLEACLILSAAPLVFGSIG